MSDKQTATRLLTHYLRLSAQRAGVQWDSDNDAEVASIVDAMIAEAVRQSQYEALQVLRSELSEDGIALVYAMAQDKGTVNAAVAQAVDSQRGRMALEAQTAWLQAQQPAEDATQEAQPVREHIQRVNDRLSVHLEDVDRDTVGVIVYDPNVKHAYVQVTVCADSDTINVYASSGREVVVKRYEDYFSHPDEHRTAVLSVSQRTATVRLEAHCAYCGRNVDLLLDAVRLDHKRYLCPTCASKALRGEKMALDILARTQPGAATSAEDDLPF